MTLCYDFCPFYPKNAPGVHSGLCILPPSAHVITITHRLIAIVSRAPPCSEPLPLWLSTPCHQSYCLKTWTWSFDSLV